MIHSQRSFHSPFFLMAAIPGDGGDETHGSSGPAPDAAPPLRVLIVEDEGLVAMNIESALTEAGFKVMGIVDTEADAVAAAERLQPDVVVMDVTLGEGNGISAGKAIVEKIKARIVFVSGNSDPRTLAEAEKVSPGAFIRKPFATDRLARLIEDALATKN